MLIDVLVTFIFIFDILIGYWRSIIQTYGALTVSFMNQKGRQIGSLELPVGTAGIVGKRWNVCSYTATFTYFHNATNVERGFAKPRFWCGNYSGIGSKENVVVFILILAGSVHLDLIANKLCFCGVDRVVVCVLKVHLAGNIVVTTDRDIELFVFLIENHSTVHICVAMVSTHPFRNPISSSCNS